VLVLRGCLPSYDLKQVAQEVVVRRVAAGRLPPRPAVWQRGNRGLRFVHAATAACGTAAPACQPSPSGPVPP